MAIFNITSDIGRLRSQGIGLRKQARLVPSAARSVRLVLDRAYLAAADLVEHATTNIDAVVDTTNPAMQQVLLQIYKRVGAVFGLDTLREFERQQKGMTDEYQREFERWSRTHAATLVVGLSATTRKALKKIITGGIAEGKTFQTIAKDIRAKRKTFNRVRALRIARTEVHTAATAATDMAVKATRVEFEREWVTAGDERVRPSKPKDFWNHRSANKQRRDQKTPFDVSGERLMQPGDPKGSPGNIINCRCSVLYHSKRNLAIRR